MRHIHITTSPVVSDKQQGQALVEFALVISIMVALLMGAMWAFQLFSERDAMETMARNAARFAAEYGGYSVDSNTGFHHILWLVSEEADSHNLDTKNMQMVVTIYPVEALDDGVLNTEEAREVGVSEEGLVPTTSLRQTRCNQYNEIVEVTLIKPWAYDFAFVGPFVRLFYPGATHTVSHIDRCWRSPAPAS